MATHTRTDLFVHFRNSYNHRGKASKRVSFGEEDTLILASKAPNSISLVASIDIEWLQWIETKKRIEHELSRTNDASNQ